MIHSEPPIIGDMRRLDLYTIREILGPLGLGFLTYTFLLLLQALFKFAKLIINNGVEPETIGRLLMLSLPSIVVMTVPMSLLFAILIAVGRLSADSELTAMRASGVSLFSLYRPIFVLSSVLALFTGYLMIAVLPKGNTALEELRLEILNQSLSQEVEPRVFYPGWEKKLLYVFEKPTGASRWKGAFLANARPFADDEVVVAEWGEAQPQPDVDQVQLFFEQAYKHRVDFKNPERYEIIQNKTVRLGLATQVDSRSNTSSGRSLRTLNLEELRSEAANPRTPERIRNLARVEIHKKFAIPAVCLVFGLLALPLGITRNRGGRSSGFVVSIGIILVYYVLLNWGEELATKGDLPAAVAVWFANIIMLIAGVYLLAQRNSDKSILLQRADRWVQEHLWSRVLRLQGRRQARRTAKRQRQLTRRRANADLVLRIPSLQLRFPNRMDRYILLAFGKVLCMALLAGLTVYLIADFTDTIDEVLENQISGDVVMAYYQYKSFTILYQIAPIIVLIATLVTFGLLSRSNEIIAAKALGMSLYRLAIPVVLAASLVALLSGLFQSEVLPAAQSQVEELGAVIKNRPVRPGIRRADRQWIDSPDRKLYNYLSYDAEREQLHRLQVFKFDERYRLTDRLVVDRATYVGDGWWTLSGGWVRSFDGPDELEFRRFDSAQKYQLDLTPDSLMGEIRHPDSMTYTELREHITDLRDSGQVVPELEVGLHNKVAYPAISLVMALVALPFSFRLGRRGALYGIGLSIILGMIFMAVLAAFTALGNGGILPPVVAVWSPGAIFAVFSLYMFLGVRT